jgi:hypothetical protein
MNLRNAPCSGLGQLPRCAEDLGMTKCSTASWLVAPLASTVSTWQIRTFPSEE